MEGIEEVQQYLTAVSGKCHDNNRLAEASQCPHACMVLWLNVCVRGQMDTFMSIWVWIILPATSGAPHGIADCSKRGRWAHGEGAPPVGSLTSIPTDGASLQMANWKVTRPTCKTNASLNPGKLDVFFFFYLLVWQPTVSRGTMWKNSVLYITLIWETLLFKAFFSHIRTFGTICGAVSCSRTLRNVDKRSQGLDCHPHD